MELAETLGCRVVRHKWKDFGANRTMSFIEAASSEELAHLTWAVAIDADMTLHCDAPRLKDFLSKSRDAGLTLVQANSGLEYRNVRLLRLSEPWQCKGVTHEYWTCRHSTVGEIPRDTAHIADIGDGGCKSDKFERDARLLEEGLIKEPDNERYYFYMANTLACQGKNAEACEFYRTRVEAGAGPKRYGTPCTSWPSTPRT